VANLVQGLGFGVISITSGLMSAQTADEQELQLGGPEQGLVFGFIFLAIKFGSALSKILSGFILDLIKFPVGKPGAPIGRVVIDHLAWAEIGSIVALGGLSLILWSGYSITNRRHTEIRAALAKRAEDRSGESAVIEVAPRAAAQVADFAPVRAARAL
jgi:Na+/melibiose symporter-like transporter